MLFPNSARHIELGYGKVKSDLSSSIPTREVNKTLYLSGFYEIRACNGSVEIEFTDIKTSNRFAIYATETVTYLKIPSGDYAAYFRSIPGRAPPESLEMNQLSAMSLLLFLVQKAVQVATSPSRWAPVAQHLLSRTKAAQGYSTAARRPIGDVPETTNFRRPIVAPRSCPLPVSIIIPTKTRYDLLGDCLASLKQISGIEYEIIIVDNGATDPRMLELLQFANSQANIQVFRLDEPFNFSRLCNFGAERAKFPLLLFLNDDVEALDGHWLSAMALHAAATDVGVIGARLLYDSHDLQHAGIATNLLPGPGHPWRGLNKQAWQHHPLIANAGEVDAVTGACLLIRKAVFERLGRFDETYFGISLNDVDLCLRARLDGLKVIYTPEATLLHKESQSRSRDDAPENIERRSRELGAFLEKYAQYARTSIFFPENLRRDREDAVLAP